jgi:hypothetical protein
MHGDDVQQQAMFSYLSPEARVPQDHPSRPIRDMVNRALAELSGEFQAMYPPGGTPFHPPGEAAARLVAASLLHHPQRPTVDGAAGLQSPISLVCRSLHGRQSLGPFRLFQESRALSRF